VTAAGEGRAAGAVLAVADEVRDAIAHGRAVVALESTIFSNLGLPTPHNHDALNRCLAAIRRVGAVPAVTAVLDGVARVGIDEREHERILGAARKASSRDVAVAVAQRWAFGATTVSASLMLAARAGVEVFATGGIGGVHRGADGDVSADLAAMAEYPVVTVSAGAKAFLDLPRTLEHLEMLAVPVLGFRTDDFPSFTLRSSGLAVPQRVDSIDEVVAVVHARRELGARGGMLLAVPIPDHAALAPHEVADATERALAEASARGLSGPAVTPFVLEYLAALTDGRTVAPNLALAENNAAVAAELAVALATARPSPR
jgi:pseudouridine-5'-phosphate glycosidase